MERVEIYKELYDAGMHQGSVGVEESQAQTCFHITQAGYEVAPRDFPTANGSSRAQPFRNGLDPNENLSAATQHHFAMNEMQVTRHKSFDIFAKAE